ncbi:porin [Sphingomonas sp. LT1P40]|uniref:porin n=1 Tax=Alteristakelama amylovorans TaxID=3096166 RepID=UPI002FC75677
MAGIGIGTLGVAGLAVAPALLAQTAPQQQRIAQKRAPAITSIGTFTPAAGDPKLAAALARSGLSGSGFRFTPADSARSTSRSVTVAVRARNSRSGTALADRGAAAPATVTLQPIAYNLGVSVGWKRFSIAGDLSKLDLAGQPGSRESAEVGVAYTGKRVAGRIKAGAERPLTSTPRLIADDPNYSIDVGGSYSLTRNLDLTAGVRYKSEENRLPQLTDNRRDSQAVYVGTAIRF